MCTENAFIAAASTSMRRTCVASPRTNSVRATSSSSLPRVVVGVADTSEYIFATAFSSTPARREAS